MMSEQDVVELLKAYRKQESMTYRALEWEINLACGPNSISAQTLHQWEHGIFTPGDKVVSRIERFLIAIKEESNAEGASQES